VVQNYLSQIRAGTLQVREAFDRLDNVALRFHGELADDFEAWSCTFVLALALAVRPEDGIPWTEFEKLRNLLLPSIQARVRGSRRIRPYDRESVSDTALLRRTLTVVERDPTTLRDVLKFQDANDAARLWFCILMHNRGLLTEIFPVLLECVKSSDRASVELRIRAAQIIGRIGEIDPVAFTEAAIYHCVRQESMSVRTSPGYMFEGAWSSTDTRYRKHCLIALQDMAQADGSTEGGRKLIWSAIAACKRLGVLDLPLAMRILQQIAERNLSEPVADLRNMSRNLREIEIEFQRRAARKDDDVFDLEVVTQLIRKWSAEIYNERGTLLFALQYTIVAMCITLDPIDILGHLRRWLTRSDGLRALTALIYLQTGGIADALSECQASPDATGNTEAREISVNPLVAALISKPENGQIVAAFLQDVFVCLRDDFPAQALPSMYASFMGHLVSMARQTAHSPQTLLAAENVFVNLLTSRITELKTRILETLRTDGIFRERGSSLETFARKVRGRALRDRTD
jgi:hypothetical protein